MEEEANPDIKASKTTPGIIIPIKAKDSITVSYTHLTLPTKA